MSQTDNAAAAATPGTMNPELAKLLVANYTSGHLAYINTAFGWDPNAGSPTGDARTTWFDFDTLMNFMTTLQTSAAALCGITDTSKLGVRLYFGEYPAASDQVAWTEILDEMNMPVGERSAYISTHAQKHTLILVPTYLTQNSNGDPINNDFDPTNAGNTPGNIVSMAQVCQEGQNGGLALMQNHGAACPPPFPVNDTYLNVTGAYFLDF